MGKGLICGTMLLVQIDVLAEAIKAFKGGLVLVSHDFRLIDQVRLPASPHSYCPVSQVMKGRKPLMPTG